MTTDPASESELPNIWGLWVERDRDGWSVLRLNDGRRTVISHHLTEAAATEARDQFNRNGLGSDATWAADPAPT